MITSAGASSSAQVSEGRAMPAIPEQRPINAGARGCLLLSTRLPFVRLRSVSLFACAATVTPESFCFRGLSTLYDAALNAVFP